MSDYYIGAYWGPRRESAHQCADRLISYADGLSRIHEAFRGWFPTGRSRKGASLRPVDFSSREIVERLLFKGRNKRDLDQSVIEDLGFSVDLWNQSATGQLLSLRVNCGSYVQYPNLKNATVLELPNELGSVAGLDCVLQALKVTARTWEPEWAGVISKTSRDSRPYNPAKPFVDWMVYINNPGIDHSKLPTTSTALMINGQGTLVVVQDRPVDPANPSDLANLTGVERALGL